MLLNDCTGFRGFHEWWGGILVLGVLAASWAHCFNSSKDTLSVFLDCTLKVKLACILSGLFPFLFTFLYRVPWSASLSFGCPTFKIESGDCIIMFVLPMYNIMLTNEYIVLVYILVLSR